MELVLEEQLNSRALSAEQSEDKKKLSVKERLSSAGSEALQDLETLQKIKKIRQTLRTVNLFFALSLAGLLVTWVIMSVQIFVGNLLGVKTIALEGIEIGIYAALSFLILMCLIIIFTLIAFAINPWNTIITTLQAGLDWIMGN